MNSPLITVILSAFNGETYINQAIQSLLDQSFTDFELILIDDASLDKTRQIITNYAKQDRRIKPIFNKQNLGLTKSLNIGLQHSSGQYIARLDADDIALPERLATQYELFEQNPDLILVGSNAVFIDENGCETGESNLPCQNFTIKATALLENPFIHSSVMLRHSCLKEHHLEYDETFDTSQDYNLWCNLLRYGNACNIKKPLIKFRYHSTSISALKRQRQIHNTHAITKYYQDCGPFKNLPPLPFELIQVGFLGDRASADHLGYNRIQACQHILSLTKRLIKGYKPKESQEYRNRIYWRILQMGLFPPFKKGWFSLFFSIIFSRNTPWPYLLRQFFSRIT